MLLGASIIVIKIVGMIAVCISLCLVTPVRGKSMDLIPMQIRANCLFRDNNVMSGNDM